LHEQRDGWRGGNELALHGAGLRYFQRWHGQDLLTRHAQRSPTGGQDLQCGAAGQQHRDKHACRDEHMLAVVEHEQDLPRAKITDQLVSRGLIRGRR
jgi:hypothetical protein